MEIVFLGVTSLAGIGVLAWGIPRWRCYRHPLRYLCGIALVGGAFLAFPWIGWWLARQDPANGGFLAFMALAGFALAASHGGRLIRRADYTPIQDVAESVFRLFR